MQRSTKKASLQRICFKDTIRKACQLTYPDSEGSQLAYLFSAGLETKGHSRFLFMSFAFIRIKNTKNTLNFNQNFLKEQKT